MTNPLKMINLSWSTWNKIAKVGGKTVGAVAGVTAFSVAYLFGSDLVETAVDFGKSLIEALPSKEKADEEDEDDE